MTKNLRKLIQLNFFFLFQKDVQATGEAFSKRALKKLIKFLVPYTGIKHLICPRVIIVLLHPDLDCESGSGSTTLIKIDKTGSDWAIKRCGSCPQSNELT
jgi:hypothetical protein